MVNSSNLWVHLSNMEEYKIKKLTDNPGLGDVSFKKINDCGTDIYVKPNSLGTVGWIFGAKYSDKDPDSGSGDSSYAAYRGNGPGYMPSARFREFLEGKKFVEIGDVQEPKKGDIAIIRTPEEFGYFSILEAGLFMMEHMDGIDLFGKDNSTHCFGKFSWSPMRIFQAGLELGYYKKR